MLLLMLPCLVTFISDNDLVGGDVWDEVSSYVVLQIVTMPGKSNDHK